MSDMLLMKSQKNDVFNIVKELTDDMSEFDLVEQPDEYYGKRIGHRLIHKPSGYYFTLGFSSSVSRYSRWAPGVEMPTGAKEFKSFRQQLEGIKSWFSYVRREVDAVDLWDIFSKGRELIDAASSDASNVPFSTGEREYILKGLDEIKQYLITAHQVDPELIEGQLKYLKEATGRVGRKDWINLLLAALVSIILNAAMPPDAARDLFRFVGTVLKEILSKPPLLLA